MIIDQPCVSCGVSLEKGVKIVSVVDFIKGCLGVIICSVLITLEINYENSSSFPKNKEGSSKHGETQWYYDAFWFILVLLIGSCIEILLAIILYFGAVKKSVCILNCWLITTGLLMPVNVFLIKIYTMIVVFAYTEDLTCEAGGKALAEFRKLPYMCNVKTQLYPSPVHGPESPQNCAPTTSGNPNILERRPTIYLTEKSFLVNVETSVFSIVQHTHRL